ncbi:MAG: S8 family serine peptidase, partial [Nitrosomonas sp.]|nr:S8 family serine peptidase [Nitrosomonas sp.]
MTTGNSSVTIAILDGQVDLSHPCFVGASIQTAYPKQNDVPGSCGDSNIGSCSHGTQIASLLFAQPGSGMRGIAPKCKGLIVPVFRDDPKVSGRVLSVSQTDLAHAIDIAREAGADIINISAGEPSKNGSASLQLASAIQRCYDKGILVVSAAGNDGCDCQHIPAALPQVLA